jgi:hypothetical protein
MVLRTTPTCWNERTMRPLPSLGAALLVVAAAVSACNGTVRTAESGTSGGDTGGAPGSSSVTAGGAPGSSSATAGGAPGITSSSSGGAGGGPILPPPFDGGPPPGDSGLTCPGLGDTCTTCLSPSCADAWCTCIDDVNCRELIACTGTCGSSDPTCTQACLAAHSEGISPIELLDSCAAVECPQACPGNTPLSACNECLFSECPAQMNTCIANSECTAYFTCVGPCNGNATCIATCQSMHAGGLEDASEVSACAAGTCSASCN